MTWEDPLDVSIYEAWRYPYVRDGQEILPCTIWPLTAEKIQMSADSRADLTPGRSQSAFEKERLFLNE